MKRKLKVVKPKLKLRKIKVKYTCTLHQQLMHKHPVEVDVPLPNPADGTAKQLQHKDTKYYEIHFVHSPLVLVNQINEIKYAQFTICTNNKEVADQYEVGQEYDKLPTQ